MTEPKFLGSIFPYEESGYDFNVSFECVEVLDQDLSIKVAQVVEIKVTDRLGDYSNDLVDMDKVARLCNEKASEALIRTRPASM